MLGAAMKKLFAVTFALATLTGPVYAQSHSHQTPQTPMQAEDAQKKKEAERTEKEYQAAMKKSQGPATGQAVVDPWQNLRGVDDGKAKR